MKEIDISTWSRRAQFNLFRTMERPHLGITAEVDVTYLIENLKPQGVSVFNAMLFCLIKSANEIEEFKTRIRAEKVIQHEVLGASVTVPIDGDNFAFCEIDYSPDWQDFNQRTLNAVNSAKQQPELTESIAGQDRWIYMSCLPWLNFTAINNPMNGPEDTIPRIVWGKFTEKSVGNWTCPVCIEGHHSLIDGLHMAKFFQKLETNILTLID